MQAVGPKSLTDGMLSAAEISALRPPQSVKLKNGGLGRSRRIASTSGIERQAASGGCYQKRDPMARKPIATSLSSLPYWRNLPDSVRAAVMRIIEAG